MISAGHESGKALFATNQQSMTYPTHLEGFRLTKNHEIMGSLEIGVLYISVQIIKLSGVGGNSGEGIK